MDMSGAGPVRPVSLDRGDGRNSIDGIQVEQLHAALDAAESDPGCRVLLLSGGGGVFSTGMDLAAAGRAAGGSGTPDGAGEQAAAAFFDLLHRFTAVPRIVVSVVDGKASGGGVGLVAASDLVYATERSTFALPEALWGLLPCCVLPFLVRRTGFQRAYAMTLTTQPVDAASAAAGGLVDEIGADPALLVRRLAFRAGKLAPDTIGDLKRYLRGLWEISEQARGQAVGELGRLLRLPAVRDRLAAFAERGEFPWEG